MHVYQNPHTLDWHAAWRDGDVSFRTRSAAIRFARNNARKAF